MPEEFTQEWYSHMSWLVDGVVDIAKEASNACWDRSEAMLECGFNKMGPDTDVLVKLFLLLDMMDDEGLRKELEHLKNVWADVYAIRHKPWLDTQWGIEDDDEEDN